MTRGAPSRVVRLQGPRRDLDGRHLASSAWYDTQTVDGHFGLYAPPSNVGRGPRRGGMPIETRRAGGRWRRSPRASRRRAFPDVRSYVRSRPEHDICWSRRRRSDRALAGSRRRPTPHDAVSRETIGRSPHKPTSPRIRDVIPRWRPLYAQNSCSDRHVEADCAPSTGQSRRINRHLTDRVGFSFNSIIDA